MKKASSFLFFVLSFFVCITQVHAASIAGNNSFQGTVGVAMPITDLQITGEAGSTVIPVKLLVTNGSLQMTTTTGLTFTGGTTGAVLYFSGTVDNVNTALATLLYTRGSAGTDTLEVSLVPYGEVFFADNGHLYEYISSTQTWQGANTAASGLSKYGATGYLATITSQNENDFVAARLSNAGWMGASDSGSEGVWRWAVGPESGTQFWSGASGGSTFGGNYANWGTGEPNDAGSNEDCGQFLAGGSGKWNDLPCTVFTLPGYVVEYGAPGALPTVTAKNISITTTSAPTASLLTPADNATNVATSTNLTIQFSSTIYASTSNILIYKGSDNTVFETIQVSSTTQVSGSGTNTITINPNSDFSENTSYYVIIPSTTFRNSVHAYYGGMSASSTWNFTIGDFTAPTIQSVSATSTSSTTATITWTTNEIASSRVWYGLISNATSTTESDISPRVTDHTVALTNLIPCATYKYTVVSRDASLNTATSSEASFVTLGCEGATTQTTATTTQVVVSAGGYQSLTAEGSTITVTAPSGFTATSSSVVIQIQSLPKSPVVVALGQPNPSLNRVGDVVFDVKAIINTNTILDSFDTPVTISYQYADEDVVGLDETTLRLYHYHDGAWSVLDVCSVNTSANIITCTTPSFSIFALFGELARSTGVQIIGPGAVGSSVQEQVAFLYKNNKNKEAEELKKQWPALFPQTSTEKKTAQKNQRNLYKGTKGQDVKALQVFLITQAVGPKSQKLKATGATGYFGQVTKDALIEFQKNKNITPAEGYFGPKTKAVIGGF